MKHIRRLDRTLLLGREGQKIGCGECQASCQSACKTSCTVGNQGCRQQAGK